MAVFSPLRRAKKRGPAVFCYLSMPTHSSNPPSLSSFQLLPPYYFTTHPFPPLSPLFPRFYFVYLSFGFIISVFVKFLAIIIILFLLL